MRSRGNHPKKRQQTTKNMLFFILLVVAAASMVVLLQGSMTRDTAETGETIPELTIYRTEQCPCCKEYETYLRRQGVAFRTVLVDSFELDRVRKKLEIPAELQSCHTAQAAQYFIEGHVPVEAIKKLFIEKPAIDGIALPGMPPGSPGMGGVKTKPLEILAKTGEKISPWMTS
ncbi:MAG: DUF411 domain-containing protein [Candidatus Caldarchaeum sp.]